MAVTLSINPLMVIANAGLSTETLQGLVWTHGLKVVTTLSSVKVVTPQGEVLTTIKLGTSELAKLSQGGEVPGLDNVLAIATAQVESAVSNLHSSANVAKDDQLGVAGESDWPAMPSTPAMSILAGSGECSQLASDLLKSGALTKDKFAPAPSASTPYFYPVRSLADMKTLPAVSLRYAVGLYQPVKGTDAPSRYFLVGDFGDLRMAARWQDSMLSIRFEAPKIAKYAAQLHMMHIIVHADKNYASIHMHGITNATVCSMAIGAIISGVGLDTVSPKPNVSLIHDQGT